MLLGSTYFVKPLHLAFVSGVATEGVLLLVAFLCRPNGGHPVERVTDFAFIFHFPGYLAGSLLQLGSGLAAAVAILGGALQFTLILWPVFILFRRDDPA
jgi:hypothetical protein